MRTYNAAGAGRGDDPFGKNAADISVLGEGPYYAIDASITSRLFPLTTLTAGGLKVEEETGVARGIGDGAS